MTSSHVGLLICSDLMFISKVTGTAQSLGSAVEVTGAAQGLAKFAQADYACILVDLSLPNLKVADVISGLGERQTPVIAFGPHVDTMRLEEARQAGCREVFSRNSFNSNLAEILKKYLSQNQG